jgi:hypothetical protein
MDYVEILKLLTAGFINMILGDPPYFLSNRSFACSGKWINVKK